jgi:hypothetical protein
VKKFIPHFWQETGLAGRSKRQTEALKAEIAMAAAPAK